MTKTESALDRRDLEYVVKRYRKRVAEHGPTFDSLSSGSKAKQRIRHLVHSSALRGGRPKVLDIGCGLGCFYRFLEAHDIACEYVGYDIVQEYINECQRRHRDVQFELRNVFLQGIDGSYDTIVMSSVLNNRYRYSDNMAVMREMLALAYERTAVSVSIDMMSTYVDFRSPEVFYYSPEEIFGLAKGIARRVVLRHDYRAYEFCVQLFHEDVEGFVR
ncbi:MAG: class I SAM-dependent methyltransferase [bacterium]|nr:class I SAM-dependent methyltransferase [bacterium]